MVTIVQILEKRSSGHPGADGAQSPESASFGTQRRRHQATRDAAAGERGGPPASDGRAGTFWTCPPRCLGKSGWFTCGRSPARQRGRLCLWQPARRAFTSWGKELKVRFISLLVELWSWIVRTLLDAASFRLCRLTIFFQLADLVTDAGVEKWLMSAKGRSEMRPRRLAAPAPED